MYMARSWNEDMFLLETARPIIVSSKDMFMSIEVGMKKRVVARPLDYEMVNSLRFIHLRVVFIICHLTSKTKLNLIVVMRDACVVKCNNALGIQYICVHIVEDNNVQIV